MTIQSYRDSRARTFMKYLLYKFQLSTGTRRSENCITFWLRSIILFLHACQHVGTRELLRMFAAHIYSMGLIFDFLPHFGLLRMFAAHNNSMDLIIDFCACLLRIFSASAHHLLQIFTALASVSASAHVCCAYWQHGPHFRLLLMFAALIDSMGLIFDCCACLLRIITAQASFWVSAHHLLHIIQHGPHFRLLHIICCA